MGRCNYTLCPPLTVAMDVGMGDRGMHGSKKTVSLGFLWKNKKCETTTKTNQQKENIHNGFVDE